MHTLVVNKRTFLTIMTKIRTKSDEADLIIGLRNRDKQSIELLYDWYAAPLLGLISRIVKDDATAHDLLKSLFLHANQHIADVDPARQRLFPWLMGMARQQAMPHYRPDQAETIATGSIALEPIEQKFLTEQIVEQQYVLGKSQQEVADGFQIPLAVVRQQTRLGLMR